LVLAAASLAACQGQDAAPVLPPPKAIVTKAEMPRSDGIAVTPEELTASDPCDLLDPASLKGIGKAETEPGSQFTQCKATISLPDGESPDVQLTFDHHLPRTGMKAARLKGVTVYEAEDENWCQRSFVLSETVTVSLGVGLGVPARVRCPVVGEVAEVVAGRLAKGGLEPAAHPQASLARQDACRLVDHRDTARVIGIDRSRYTPEFGGQGCTWGIETIDKPNAYVSFNRGRTMAPATSADRRTTIAGRPALVQPEAPVTGENATPGGCAVDFAHRPLDRPTDLYTHEMVHMSVSMNAPEKQSCDLVVELAGKAIAKLPKT
jgi:hypothetical protein